MLHVTEVMNVVCAGAISEMICPASVHLVKQSLHTSNELILLANHVQGPQGVGEQGPDIPQPVIVLHVVKDGTMKFELAERKERCVLQSYFVACGLK